MSSQKVHFTNACRELLISEVQGMTDTPIIKKLKKPISCGMKLELLLDTRVINIYY